MSNKSRLQTNNINLQELINKANALPDAGSGGSGGGTSGGTVSVTIYNQSANPVYYWDANGAMCEVASYSTQTVNALNGVVFYAQETYTDVQGRPYTYSFFTIRGVCVATFWADGGQMTCYSDMGGA